MQAKTPTWFWIAAVFFLLWNILGVLSFIGHTFIMKGEALAALPEAERALYEQYSLWTTLVFATAVIFGLLGSVGLLLRKKWAKTAFIISLCAIIPQMIHNVFFTDSIAVYGVVQAVTMPILVVVFGVVLVGLSHFSAKRGWLG